MALIHPNLRRFAALYGAGTRLLAYLTDQASVVGELTNTIVDVRAPGEPRGVAAGTDPVCATGSGIEVPGEMGQVTEVARWQDSATTRLFFDLRRGQALQAARLSE